MTKTTKRIISLVVSLPILALGVFGMFMLISQKEPPPKRSNVQGVREVAVKQILAQDVPVNVSLQGRLVAVETVPLFAEVTGVFQSSSKPFKVGIFFKKGDLLARLDATEARYALLAQKSAFANVLAQAMPELKIDYSSEFQAWDAYLRSFDPEKPLPVLPEITDDAARYFLNGRNIFNQYYTIKGAEERMSKYELRAPVSGTLTEVGATVGALVRAGQPLGTLTASNYEMAATVPVADLNYMKPGTKASLVGPNGESYQGSVSRISTQIDPNTQTATLYLNVRGNGLREGLYLTGTAMGDKLDNVIALDQSLLVGTNELYVVRDSVLQREMVEIVRRGDKQVFVKGLPDGQFILGEAVPGAYVGMRVRPRKLKSSALPVAKAE